MIEINPPLAVSISLSPLPIGFLHLLYWKTRSNQLQNKRWTPELFDVCETVFVFSLLPAAVEWRSLHHLLPEKHTSRLLTTFLYEWPPFPPLVLVLLLIHALVRFCTHMIIHIRHDFICSNLAISFSPPPPSPPPPRDFMNILSVCFFPLCHHQLSDPLLSAHDLHLFYVVYLFIYPFFQVCFISRVGFFFLPGHISICVLIALCHRLFYLFPALL